ncbi:MAG: DNA-processing protein DprA [Clostridia bacterium]
MTRYIIALSELGIKNNNLISLLQSFPLAIGKMFTDDFLFESSFELIIYKEYFSNKDLVNKALFEADMILEKNKELNIKTTFYTDKNYPKELAKIDDPPAIIYYKGEEFSRISEYAIACVGTRKPTKFSYNAVNYLVPQWVNNNCSIISGLACGVDKLSHQSCISSGGKTIAVLAHGLDMVYPKENRILANRILSNGGTLMSEYPVGKKADKFRFVNRNRLIVGMSRAVVIYECDEKSGTMHNAQFALQQKKPIFCPDIGDKISEFQTGTKKLIDEHVATVIKQGRDIKGVLAAVGIKNVKIGMRNIDIKKIFLHAVLSVLNSKTVLKETIQELELPVHTDDSFYEDTIKLIDDNKVNIDTILNALIINNIESKLK